jgi:FdhD protein
LRLARLADGAPEGIAEVQVNVVADGAVSRGRDKVTVEEPLEIRLLHGPNGQRTTTNVAVTMRTPGDDLALALGFLHGEGVLHTADEVVSVHHVEVPAAEDAGNVVEVELAPSARFDVESLSRNVYTTSSCGICGKASLDAVRVQVPDQASPDTFTIAADVLGGMPNALRREQASFSHTGGLHASGAFDATGQIRRVAEDVGRHNALDKLIGGELQDGALPMLGLGLIFSGRTSFELVQKAALASCPFVAAIGPPSSLAVELAAEVRMTLVGFLREDRFNIYTLPHRVQIEA